MKILSMIFILLLSINSIFSQTGESNIPRAKADTIFYQLDEVVITGTRFSKKIVDIPYSITRMDNVDFKYDRKVSVSDVMGNVPGLFMQSRYGNHDVRMSIRGFGSRSNSGIRGVRILLDDIPESEPDGQTRIEAIDFNSIGTIEVVKGNSSSLYTNAPGGVVNFRNDINFVNSSIVNFNDFGSYGLRRNGFKLALRSKDYGFLLTYSYHNYDGYRVHSNDYWHIVNTVIESTPSEMSKLQILGYFVSGIIKLPGSLTKEEFEKDPMQADTTEVGYDTKRISKKGRVGLRFISYLDEEKNNEIEITSYGTIKYFERTAKDYRIINRYGLGASGRFLNKSTIFDRLNEFAIGGDLFYQTGPIETYKNYSGTKGDQNTAITDETIINTGFFISNSFEILPKRLSFLLTGRLDKVLFDNVNMINESQNAVRKFQKFTPKAALNYKLLPSVSIYTSYGMSFDSPAGNEMENFPLSTDGGSTMLNPDLKPQKSNNFELGIKGNLVYPQRNWLNDMLFEVTFFNSIISD
ncbi:MAG: TonB-dependent receptor, partial [Ignavibacteria bacterium]|nr:TonB-dependent receptor [Ignavibacteria bacterium]